MFDPTPSLYERLGGYDAIAAIVDDLLPRLLDDPRLGVYWKGKCTDSLNKDRQPVHKSAADISKHLRVLEQCRLITRTKTGRITYCQLTRQPFADASRWLAEHDAFWEQQLDALDEYLKEDQWPTRLRAPGASR